MMLDAAIVDVVPIVAPDVREMDAPESPTELAVVLEALADGADPRVTPGLG